MNAELAIRDYLLSDGVIGPAVGLNSPKGPRIYPHDNVPQTENPADDYPVITYQRASEFPQGVTLDADELPYGVRLQLNVLATTYKAAADLAIEIRRLFRGGYATTDLQLARLGGGGALARDPGSRLFGVRIDLLLTLGAAEAAA